MSQAAAKQVTIPQTIGQGKAEWSGINPRSFKMISLNIAGYQDRDVRQLIRKLRRTNPDIVFLQGVSEALFNNRHPVDAATVAGAMGMSYHYGINKHSRPSFSGNLTLSAFPIAKKFSNELAQRVISSCDGSLYTKVRYQNNRYLHLFNVNLKAAIRKRRHQLKNLLKRSGLIDETLADPVIICGFDQLASARLRRLEKRFSRIVPQSFKNIRQKLYASKDLNISRVNLLAEKETGGTRKLLSFAVALDSPYGGHPQLNLA